MRGRPYAMGLCRSCGHRNYEHGYIGPIHTCGGCRREDIAECQHYVRDRRKAVGDGRTRPEAADVLRVHARVHRGWA